MMDGDDGVSLPSVCRREVFDRDGGPGPLRPAGDRRKRFVRIIFVIIPDMGLYFRKLCYYVSRRKRFPRGRFASRRCEKEPNGTDGRSASCAWLARGQSGARTAPARNARPRPRAGGRAVRAAKGPAPAGLAAGAERSGTKRDRETAMRDTNGHWKSPLPLAGEAGRGPAAGQPGNALPRGQDGLPPRPSLASEGGRKSERTMTDHDISGGAHDKT